jgi:hypothetical protein
LSWTAISNWPAWFGHDCLFIILIETELHLCRGCLLSGLIWIDRIDRTDKTRPWIDLAKE